jgi:hypothetical protein
MLSQQQLGQLAKSRLAEAQVLHENGHWDGAAYLCGYSVELALKCVILQDRLWGFPEDSDEFDLYKQVKTHELGDLFILSRRNEKLQGDKDFWVAWQCVRDWCSEFRYRPIGEADEPSSKKMLDSSRVIMSKLGIS